MNERQQSHIDYYLQRLEYWKGRKPAYSTARLLAARDADEAHPLRTEEEATEAHRAGGEGEELAAAAREVRQLELVHDGYVGRVGALRDRVVAELDVLIGWEGRGRSSTAEDADA